MARTVIISMVVFVLASLECRAQEKLFSGPQVGEKLPTFRVRGVFGPNAGAELDFVKQAAGEPIVLVFIHDVNRPSLRMTHVLTNYTVGRVSEGLATGVIWLSDDVTEAENILKSKTSSLAQDAPTGISLDGREGPGSYGLNRNVALTILIGKEGKITANFALVQPSIQADLPQILHAIAQVTGGPAATLEDVMVFSGVQLQGAMLQLLQRTAKPEVVDKEAVAIEKYVKENEAARNELGRIAGRAVESGKLTNHGSPRAQEYLRKWAKEYGDGRKP